MLGEGDVLALSARPAALALNSGRPYVQTGMHWGDEATGTDADIREQVVYFQNDVLEVRNKSNLNEHGLFEVEDSHYFTTSFEILWADGFRRDHLALLGAAPNGDSVIEKWKKKNVGFPGAPAYVFAKKQLFASTQYGSLQYMAPDPGLAYVVAASGQFLIQVAVASPHSVLVLEDTASLPELPQVRSLWGFDHVSDGRVWVAEIPSMDKVYLLRDVDFDGGVDVRIMMDDHLFGYYYTREDTAAEHVDPN